MSRSCHKSSTNFDTLLGKLHFFGIEHQIKFHPAGKHLWQCVRIHIADQIVDH